MPASEAGLRKRAFDPVVDARTRVLILGSLPGDASLKAGQYYGHPQNAFWRLIGAVIDIPDLHLCAYEDRLTALLRRGVGLWDVIAEAERIGSLDTAIRQSEPADLRGLIAALPDLRAVAFNGGKAAAEGVRILGAGDERIARVILPSSSPAHTRPVAEKATAWAGLRPFLIIRREVGEHE